MRNKVTEIPPKIRHAPVTMEWRPNLAFKLMTTAEQKRAWVKYGQTRNYRERVGQPIRWYGSIVITSEMAALRNRVARLESLLVNRSFARWESAATLQVLQNLDPEAGA